MLKPQDVVVLLKLVVLKDVPWTIASLAESLHMSSSEVHAALSRAQNAGLYLPSKRKRAALPFKSSSRMAFAMPLQRSDLA